MSRLVEFSSADQLKKLVDKLTNGGKRSHCFENMAVQNICLWKLESKVPTETIDIYGFPAENPLYVFYFERSHHQFPQLHVRTPSEGHDCTILADGLKEMMSVALSFIENQGKELLLDADTVVQEAFFKLIKSGEFPFTIRVFGDLIPFYMNKSQQHELLKMKLTSPDGFKIDEIKIEKEYEGIHAALSYADEAAPELTRLRLGNIPSVCIRDEDGNLASWQMSHHYGQLTHLYTVPSYRGKGLGVLTELLLAHKLAKCGLQVFKYVDFDNEKVFGGTMRHPLWTRWVSTRENNEKEEGEEDIMWSYSIFTLVQ
ncbi:hypothetical protein PRIPAC_80104 [Pristionchus pacificus]|uniref:Glycine N-acyltransferase-like protein n=1 Tax=Pristionchus pacificus TaxID=54126 RepID=A0A2A6C2Z9_PRIPA|nr:hypothetical protein PRIPAC_80104 [Pristionchus pacificus]|eukprot:PDM72489.1 hypothetical protein PRIPAC_38923 [Pristionchus pacificus]